MKSGMKGGVNFPVDDPDYKDTSEGGMFVRLMVIERGRKYNDPPVNGWIECSGGRQRVRYDESLVDDGDRTLTKRLFPRLSNDGPSQDDHSVPCLAVATLGSTRWSGHRGERGGYWRCGEDDLNERGRKVLDGLKALHGDAEYHLTTWLDT